MHRQQRIRAEPLTVLSSDAGPTEEGRGAMNADAVVQLVFGLFAGGGGLTALCLVVRAAVREWGETSRTRIRERAQTERLMIERVMPLPRKDRRMVEKRSDKKRTLDAA